MSSGELSSLVSRLESVTARLENVVSCHGSIIAGQGGGDEVVVPFVQAYDGIVSGSLTSFLQLSDKVGSDVKTIAEMVKRAFGIQREFLVVASKSKSPDQGTLMQLLKPTSDQIQAIQGYREKNRASSFFNHLSAISESIPALGWVAVTATPSPYVKEMVDASQFYTNRVLMDYKEKDKNHVDWVKAWIQTLTELQAYVKEHHTTGLVWNAKGTGISGSVPGGAPPPPPPLMDLSELTADLQGDGRAALFKELNQGEGVTKGLKKVSSDQQTHKNPALRETATVKPAVTGPRPFKPATAAPASVKPPKFELQGKKWILEHQKDNHNLLISQTEMNQAVYVYSCENCTIQVQGKINSIVLDACKKSSVVFDSLVASLEFINCQRVQAQVLGKVPTISIDKTDGVQIYLNSTTLDASIVSSKSSEMNIMIPKDDDYVEYPVPEQYKTTWSGKGLITEVIEQKG